VSGKPLARDDKYAHARSVVAIAILGSCFRCYRVRHADSVRLASLVLSSGTIHQGRQDVRYNRKALRVLSDITPSQQQRRIISDYKPGYTLIRGAAGSGKTTTAVLRLRQLAGVWRRQRVREDNDEPTRVLVLTYNRTLRGYIAQLVSEQVRDLSDVDLTLDTFGHWAWTLIGRPELISGPQREAALWRFGANLGLSRDFLLEEVEYVLSRYLPEDLHLYATPDQPTYRRRGRGQTPRMQQRIRARLLEEVIPSYAAWKLEQGEIDWNDVALQLHATPTEHPYDVVIVDEAQDFSANQLRALDRQLAERHSTTFVLDALQQIYPRGFTWQEIGIEIPSRNMYRLEYNFRNTREVAAFARPLVEGLEISDDGTLPDFESTVRTGPKPQIIKGRFSRQMDYIVERIAELPAGESVALLHPKGGGWFDYTRQRLHEAGLPFVELTRRAEWPKGDEDIALSTLHSAKGLEFDHVVLLGLNTELMPHGSEDKDTQLENHRRLVAMAIGRARKSTTLSFRPDVASAVIDYLDEKTFETVDAG
jgi:superfamily I DNA/RNA helicase